MLRLALILLVVLPLPPLTVADRPEQTCERLKATLKYTQEEAPQDLSTLLPVVVEKVNRVLDGVVDVDIEWTGADLHGRVGEHIVRCKVTRLAGKGVGAGDNEDGGEVTATDDSDSDGEVFLDGLGRKVKTQCFHVPFTILDTDECRLPKSHPMRHKCHAPAMCVNTIGSYECMCPRIGNNLGSTRDTNQLAAADESFWKTVAEQDRNPWELSFQANSRSSCLKKASTHGCCSERGHTDDGASCRERFRCPVDPCNNDGYYEKRSSSQNNAIDSKMLNDCSPSAQCVRADSPMSRPHFTCECPKGLMGNGHTCRKSDPKPNPMVMYDGVTPTDLTVKNNFYCGCTEPTVDACSGFPPCKGKHEMCIVTVGNKPKCGCEPGFAMHETYGCVDVHPPRLRLKNDPAGDRTLRLKQGDEYKEYMVDIVDENAEDYFRSLKITYSEPLPPGCLTKVGELHVNYTIAMPWASPPYVRVTRRVVVEDIDECSADISKFKTTCPSLVPQCDYEAGATCVNKVGSYDCRCPSYSTGDGFLKTASFPSGMQVPSGFEGGTSCVDTSKPVITLKGPNPKVFKTCACGRLSGVIDSGAQDDDEDKQLQDGQRGLYEDDIKEMILSSAGAELCATHTNIRPSPADCVTAVDHTYKGDVDLSKRVVVGEPVKKSLLHWAVPYDVTDDAGNKAATVWRDVIVQEIELSNLEAQIREEILREQEVITKKAVDKAVREERMKVEKADRMAQASKRGAGCPPCPKCSCPLAPTATEESCRKFCDSNSQETCAYGARFLWTDIFSSWLIPLVASVVGTVAIMLAIRWVFIAWQSFGYQRYGGYDNDVADGNDGLFREPAEPRPVTTPRNPATSAARSPGTFFSPSSQTGAASPRWSDGTPNGSSNTPSNHQETRYSHGIFTPPPGLSQQSAFS